VGRLFLLPGHGLNRLLELIEWLVINFRRGPGEPPVQLPQYRNPGEERALGGLGDLVSAVVCYGLIGVFWLIGSLLLGPAPASSGACIGIVVFGVIGLVPKKTT
jgi:hypothetical protein